MALIPGDITCVTGLSKKIHDAFLASGVSTNLALRGLSFAIASAIVTEITTNAVVNPTALLSPPGTAGGPVTGTGTIT